MYQVRRRSERTGSCGPFVVSAIVILVVVPLRELCRRHVSCIQQSSYVLVYNVGGMCRNQKDRRGRARRRQVRKRWLGRTAPNEQVVKRPCRQNDSVNIVMPSVPASSAWARFRRQVHTA